MTAGDFMAFHVDSKKSQWTTHILDGHVAQRHKPWVHFRGQCGQFIDKYDASTGLVALPLCAGVRGVVVFPSPIGASYICRESHTGRCPNDEPNLRVFLTFHVQVDTASSMIAGSSTQSGS